jgi:hypothetical protein
MGKKGKRLTAAEETAFLKEMIAAIRRGATLVKNPDGSYTVVEPSPDDENSEDTDDNNGDAS